MGRSVTRAAVVYLPARDENEARGVVVVTHRLAALGAADEVILLGTGQDPGACTVIARGTHAELLATVPEYRWAAQED